MKAHHIAALALVGWSLMMPPLSQDPPRVLYDQPLSSWSVLAGPFNTAAECQQARKTAVETKASASLKVRRMSPEGRALVAKAIRGAKCVATDDPRLNSN